MSELIYVDTNIWLDYIQERKGKYLDFQDFARRILNRTLPCEFRILVSDVVIFEIRKVSSIEFLNDFKRKLIFCKTRKEHKNFSKEISIHYPDNLHVAIAKLEKCFAIITNDKEMLRLNVGISIISSQDL